jgi:hypothetical protein
MAMKMPKFTIRGFAVICVAVTSAYVMYMGWLLNETLSGPGWCRTALGAEKSSTTDGTIKGLDACVGLLTIQLKSLATNSHILLGSVALCLSVLIIIVIAGAKFSGEGWGAKVDIERGDALPVTVQNLPSDPVPVAPTEATGPAMPEPGVTT